ncbi:MAG: intermembrane transport protein PqiB [Acidobacteriota bacterium]
MSKKPTDTEEPLPAPRIRRRQFSIIWILPIVAAAIAGWLGYTTYGEKGPRIAITFKTGAGLEAGKTRIKHHDIELGIVQRIDPTPDLSEVVVYAQMNKLAESHMTDGSKFWVARPRLSLTNLSGLDTLVSGSYIEMDPGAGKPTLSFQGLEEPPVVRADVPGTTYMLTTDKIRGYAVGSPVFFRGIDVGEVVGSSFVSIEKGFNVRVFVRAPYDGFVRQGTRFWNATGIAISTDAGGLKVQMESLEAVLEGGIAFETPQSARDRQPVKADTVFALYDDRASAQESAYTKRVTWLFDFTGSVRGLEIGAPVEMSGIKIGRVIDLHLVVDAEKKTVTVPVLCEIDLDRVGVVNLSAEQIKRFGSDELTTGLVDLGLRAQLRSSSLLTGTLLVALDFFPEAPPAKIDLTGTYPKFPTVPATMESITRSVNRTLDKLASLPLEDVVQDLRKTLDAAQQLMRNTDARSGPLMMSLRQTSEDADTALKSMTAGYGRDSQLRGELAELLRQLNETLKSVSSLANYIQQHPDAFVRGKGTP